MKTLYSISILGLFLTGLSFAAAREINLHTEKVGEVMHWMPEKVEVTRGEEVKFIVKHDLEGGFDFHGFFLPALHVEKQINRHKAEEFTVKIPKDMKPGEYPIGCQFHPKHAAATLIVK